MILLMTLGTLLVGLWGVLKLFFLISENLELRGLKDQNRQVVHSGALKMQSLDFKGPRENPWFALWHMGDPGLNRPVAFSWGGKCYEDDVVECNIVDRTGARVLKNWTEVLTEPSEGMAISQYHTCVSLADGAARECKELFFVGGFSEGRALVRNGDGLLGYLDRSLHPVIPCEYVEAREFHDGLAAVRCQSGSWQFIDLDGRPVCEVPTAPPPGFALGDNTVLVRRLVSEPGSESVWAYVDLERRWMFKTGSEGLWPRDFSEGLAGVQVADLWGFIDRDGKWVIPPQYLEVGTFSEGRAAVLTRAGCVYIDRAGKRVFNGVFTAATAFRNGRARIIPLKGTTWGMIDAKGNIVLEPIFADLGDLADGVIPFAKTTGSYPEKLWGLLDAEGREIVAPRFREISTFSEGVGAAEESSRRAGFIDATGAWIFEPEYDQTWSFRGGFARVRWSHL